jgi:hypothetical protein
MQVARKSIVVILITSVIALVAGCSSVSAPTSMNALPGSPQNPPLPKTNSPLPLDRNSIWVYTYQVYDSTGGLLFPATELTFRIPEVYGVQNGSVLTAVDWNNYQTAFPEYFYASEWDASGNGFLIAYRYQNVAVRGLYIVGQYGPGASQIFDTAHLWLAYPAVAGYSYSYNLDSTGDTANIRTMKVVSTKTPYYFPDSLSTGPSPLTFVECYLYKQTYHDTTSYYYYNENYGAVAYQEQYRNKMTKSYVLKAYQNGNRSYYYGY